jgi:phosphohistidine phosphatase
LILVRHGAAAARAESGGDLERPLTAEGRQAIKALAQRLSAHGPPDAILRSPARRTAETLEVLVRALSWTVPPVIDDRLYPGDSPALLRCLHELDPALERVLVVGHNPDIAELAAYLGGGSAPREFRPGAAAVFETAEPWSKLGSRTTTLVAAYPP